MATELTKSTPDFRGEGVKSGRAVVDQLSGRIVIYDASGNKILEYGDFTKFIGERQYGPNQTILREKGYFPDTGEYLDILYDSGIAVKIEGYKVGRF